MGNNNVDGIFSAYILVINGRFYCGYKNKRINTSWSLAGANLFNSENEVLEVEKFLLSKNKKFKRLVLELKDEK